jgi:deazaflavin-dependent oxidoreductase (nitroreductase family)
MSDTSDELAKRQQWNNDIIDEFRANDGKVGGVYDGLPLLLLHSVGARSGTPRINPMMYLAEGDRFVVFASNAGRDIHPGWFHNVVASPDTTVEVGERTTRVHATVADPAERRRLYDIQAELHPGFKGYESGTDRVIPVVILTPQD